MTRLRFLGCGGGLRRKGRGNMLTCGFLYHCGEGTAPGRGSFATDATQRFGVNVGTYSLMKTRKGGGNASRLNCWKRWL